MLKTELFKVFTILIFAGLILSTLMQSTTQGAVTGKISGTIIDSQTKEAIPGVNVLVEGTTLGAATSPDGEYFIIGVPPGIYTVTASVIGYQRMSVAEVRVMVDRTTTVDYSMKVTAIESKEAVVITAERPTIIRDLTATATHTDAQVFQSAPVQDTRDLINLSAGILRDSDGNIYIRGGESNQLKFYVDGVSMEQLDTRSEGFRDASRHQTSKFEFNLLGVQEMEVITGGFNAEYGDAQSGVVNIATKEGGGAYHGEFRVEYSPPGQYHFGPYVYDTKYQYAFTGQPNPPSTGRPWLDFNQWVAWNATRTNPKQYADSLAGWYQRWLKIMQPSPGHRGGLYDYRQRTYKRGMWGVGGPILGNKFTFFFSGELRAKPSLITSGFKDFAYSNLDFNTTYRITPKMKLKMKVFQGFEQHQDYWAENGLYDSINITTYGGLGVNVRFFSYYENFTVGESMTFTHTLTPTTFYEVFVSHIRDNLKSTDMDRGFPDSKAWWMPMLDPVSAYIYPTGNGTENTGDGDRHNYRYRGDLTSQLNAHNQLKVGTEGRMYNGYKFSSQTGLSFANANWNASAYHLTPRYFSTYVQDKMEYGGMIANLGVRADYYDNNKDVPVDPHNPPYHINMNQVRGSLAMKANNTYTRISPRIGFSHPVSENTAFHFQYGHFYQAPGLDMVNNYGTYGGGYQYYPNANLQPAKTVSYEFGLQHNIGGTHRLNIVGYFNDLTNQLGTVREYFPNSGNANDRFFTLVYQNNGYGTAKGLEATLDRTAVGKWYYRVTYTLARVFTGKQGANEEWSSDPNDPRNWTSRQDARTFLRGTDRTHRITGILQFRSPTEWGKLLGDWELTTDVMIQSGMPFTYTMSYDESVSLVNNRRFPFDQTTDLTIRKWVRAGKFRPQISMRVTNLLNNKWIRPQSSSDRQRWLQYNQIYTDLDHPQWRALNYAVYYNEARRIYLSVGFSF